MQEEACILGVPNVTIRDVTERPETLEVGSNILAGTAPDSIVDAVTLVATDSTPWMPPADYTVRNVAETVRRLVLGFGIPNHAERKWMSRE